MKLLLRRSQRVTIFGKSVFMLDVRAEFTEQERQYIDRYELGDEVLYTRGEIDDPGSGLLGLASRLAFHALNISISINDLTTGKRVECTDIVEMALAEERLREAAGTLKAVLQTAAHFGGEEIVEF